MNVYEVRVLFNRTKRHKLSGREHTRKTLIILAESLGMAEAKVTFYREKLSDKESVSVKETTSINLIKKVDII